MPRRPSRTPRSVRRARPDAPTSPTPVAPTGGAGQPAAVTSLVGAGPDAVDALLAALPEPAYVRDRSGRLLAFNPAAVTSGLVVPATSTSDAVAADPAVDDRQGSESGRAAVRRLSVIGEDGVERTFLVTTSPLRNAAGEVTGTLATARALTPPAAITTGAEPAAGAHFHLAWETSTDAMALSDRNGIVLAINPAYTDLFGYDAADVVGRSFTRLFPPAERAAIAAEYRAIFASPHAPGAYRYRIRRSNGTTRDVEVEFAFVEQDGVRGALFSTLRNATERKQIEGELLEEQERFRGAFEAAAIGMCLVAPDGRFLRVNQALCGILGRPEEALVGRQFQEFTHPEDLTVDLDLLNRVLAGELSSYQMEKRYLQPSGEVVWTHLVTSLVRDRDGNPTHFVSQIEDVTPRKAAEAATAAALAQMEAANRALEATNVELEQQSQAKSAFISVISHEFRTPLTSIQGFSELIADEVDSLADAQAFATTINQSAIRLARMVRDVLDLDRMTAGRVELTVKPIALNELVSAVLTSFGSPAGHEFVTSLDPASPVVPGDRDRLIQVVTNLIANAIKYSPGGGPIAVTTRAGEDEVEIEIADEGLGIPPEYRERIFAPYERVPRRGQTTIEGTGLGLSISRNIVTLHRGRIWVEPNEPHGAVFHVVLPITA